MKGTDRPIVSIGHGLLLLICWPVTSQFPSSPAHADSPLTPIMTGADSYNVVVNQ